MENKILEEGIEIEKEWIKEIKKLRKEIRKEIEKHYSIQIASSIPIKIIKETTIEEGIHKKYLIEISFIEYLEDEKFNSKILKQYLKEINKIISKYNLKKERTKDIYLLNLNDTKDYSIIVYLKDSNKEKFMYYIDRICIKKDKDNVIVLLKKEYLV